MSVNIKENGNLTKVANNISIAQSNWNDRGNTSKNTCIKNQPATLNTLEEISANTDANALAGANAVKELNDSLENLKNNGSAEYTVLAYSESAMGSSGNYVTVQLTDDINNYRYLILSHEYPYIENPAMVTVGMFKACTGLSSVYINTTNKTYIKYKTNTSIDVVSLGYGFGFYGIK